MSRRSTAIQAALAPAPAGRPPLARSEPAPTRAASAARLARASLTRVEDARFAVLAAAALALGGLTLVLPSAPTYDPWSWINWGREIVALELDTRGGPAWKPLPVLFTAPFSLAGDAAPLLWLAVARAGGLLALLMAFRLAARLAGGTAYAPAALLAGVGAALALASSSDLVRDVALGSSEGLLAALALGAFERHLDGRVDQALTLGVAVALLRPEAWPFLLAYAALAWVRLPARRGLVVGLLALLPALWFAPELWGSGELLRSAGRAQILEPGSPALADLPALEVVRQFERSLIAPVELAALAALAWALARARAQRATLALTALGAVWVALVAAMTQGGYAGETRYLVVGTATVAVLAGVGLARLAQGAAALVRRLPGGPAARAAAAAAAAAIGLAAVAALALPRAGLVPEVADGLGHDARIWGDLGDALERAGGRGRVLACGPPFAAARHVPMVAWELRSHGIDVGLDPRTPGVAMQLPEREGGPPLPPAGAGFALLAAAGEARIAGACASSGARGASS